MNLTTIFKPIAQQVVNAALPGIKAQVLDTITKAVVKANLPASYQADALEQIGLALDAWTIKL